IPASKFARRFSLRSKKEDEKSTNRGLIDFPNLLLAENTPKMNENDSLTVVNFFIFYCCLFTASTSGCCSCRGDEHERCDQKYAVLEQEISKLKFF
uniref:Uncharacterized protein n=1 Tax=Romanomermis culicivorax TaxID=13658 RepID=A0A915J985_ROMCU